MKIFFLFRTRDRTIDCNRSVTSAHKWLRMRRPRAFQAFFRVRSAHAGNPHAPLRRGSCINVYRITTVSNQNSSVTDAANWGLQLSDRFLPQVSPRPSTLVETFVVWDPSERRFLSGKDALSTGTSRLFACEIVSRITMESRRDDIVGIKRRRIDSPCRYSVTDWNTLIIASRHSVPKTRFYLRYTRIDETQRLKCAAWKFVHYRPEVSQVEIYLRLKLLIAIPYPTYLIKSRRKAKESETSRNQEFH